MHKINFVTSGGKPLAAVLHSILARVYILVPVDCLVTTELEESSLDFAGGGFMVVLVLVLS